MALVRNVVVLWVIATDAVGAPLLNGMFQTGGGNHAEQNAINALNAAAAPAAPGGPAPGIGTVQIWMSTCSGVVGGGAAALLAGCIGLLRGWAAATGANVQLHCQHPYQGRMAGQKAQSVAVVNATNAAAIAGGPQVTADFSTRTGIAAGLPPYVPPVGAPGTVAQFEERKGNRKRIRDADAGDYQSREGEEEQAGVNKRRKNGTLTVIYE